MRPLSSVAVGALVDESLAGSSAPEFEAACHHSTGGNPLLVRELLRELASKGAEPSLKSAGLLDGFGVEAVARNVRRRLHDLGPRAEAVAQAVAVVGDGATVVEAAALSQCDEEAVRAAAAELVAADLLHSESRLSFVHPLVRAAVYEDMAAVEREQLHHRVAELRRKSGDPEQVAVHLLHVEPRSEPRIVEVLRAAAAEAGGRGAPDAAATFLRRALAEPPTAGAERAGVLVELGQAEAMARIDGFEQHLREAIAEIADPEHAAEVALSLALALASLGDGSGALEVLEGPWPRCRRERWRRCSRPSCSPAATDTPRCGRGLPIGCAVISSASTAAIPSIPSCRERSRRGCCGSTRQRGARRRRRRPRSPTTASSERHRRLGCPRCAATPCSEPARWGEPERSSTP